MREKVKKIVLEGIESVKPSALIDHDMIKKVARGKRNIFVVGFGKASCSMAQALEDILGDKISGGLVIDVKKKKLKYIKVVVGTHPSVSKKNIDASKELIKIVKGKDKDDLIICLVSGGGSSLFDIPTMPLQKYNKIIDGLIDSNTPIDKINKERKKISTVKGGKLLDIIGPRPRILSLIISDVIGNSPEVVASGPTINNHKKNSSYLVIGTNRIALQAIKKSAKGMKPRIISDSLKGEISSVSRHLESLSKKLNKGQLYIFGGETTVNVKGKGTGGRNQELCLRMIDKIKNRGITFCAIGTDGIDHSPAAGAIIDSNSWKKKVDRKKYIDNDDSYNYFKKTGEAIVTGPTGTNVADIILMYKSKNE